MVLIDALGRRKTIDFTWFHRIFAHRRQGSPGIALAGAKTAPRTMNRGHAGYIGSRVGTASADSAQKRDEGRVTGVYLRSKDAYKDTCCAKKRRDNHDSKTAASHFL
ncbi:MAG: hypothetical protein ACM3SV_10445 [Betaproteobacteria bacterium]